MNRIHLLRTFGHWFHSVGMDGCLTPVPLLLMLRAKHSLLRFNTLQEPRKVVETDYDDTKVVH